MPKKELERDLAPGLASGRLPCLSPRKIAVSSCRRTEYWQHSLFSMRELCVSFCTSGLRFCNFWRTIVGESAVLRAAGEGGTGVSAAGKFHLCQWSDVQVNYCPHDVGVTVRKWPKLRRVFKPLLRRFPSSSFLSTHRSRGASAPWYAL